MIPLDEELQWVDVKKSHSDRPRHIQAYSILYVNLAYTEPWYIQNPDIFKTRNIFRALVYSEPWFTQNSGIFKTQGLFRHLQ